MLFLLTLLFGVAQGSIKDCAPSSLFKLNGLAFWPDPPTQNENSTISLDYTIPAGTSIDAGSVVYSVTYNFIPFSPTTEDLCTNTKCPLLPGTYNQSTSSNFPDLSGSVTITSKWYDSLKNLLLCYVVQVKV